MSVEIFKTLGLVGNNFKFRFLRALIVLSGSWMSIGPYGFMDDYSILDTFNVNGFDIEIYLSSGRPISGIFSYLIFSGVETVQDFWLLHVLGILIVTILVESLAIYFSKYEVSQFRITVVATSAVLLAPGLILITIWLVMVANSIAMLPAIAAAFLIRKQNRNKMHVLISFMLLILSFLAYPPYATLFLALPCLGFLLSIKNQGENSNFPFKYWKDLISKSSVVFLIAAVSSIILIKWIALPYGENQRMTLFGDLNTKLFFLFEKVIPTVFDFFVPNHGFSAFGIAVLGFLILFPAIKQKSPVRTYTFIVILIGISITISPVIVTGENWASHRALGAGQFFVIATLVILLTSLPVKRNLYPWAIKASTLLLLSVFLTFHNFALINETMRKPQLIELEQTRNALKDLDITKTIQVKSSSWSDSISPWSYGDEFGIPSSCQLWVPIPLTKILLQEIHPGIKSNVVLVEKITAQNSIDFSSVLSSSKA